MSFARQAEGKGRVYEASVFDLLYPYFPDVLANMIIQFGVGGITLVMRITHHPSSEYFNNLSQQVSRLGDILAIEAPANLLIENPDLAVALLQRTSPMKLMIGRPHDDLRPSDEFLRTLAASSVQDLSIAGTWQASSLATFARVLPAMKLEHLSISKHTSRGDLCNMRLLIAAIPNSHVTYLTLSRINLTDIDLKALVAILPRSRIVSLCISCNANITAAGLEALTAALPFCCLRSLDISSCFRALSAVPALVTASLTSRLKVLKIESLALQDVQALASALPQSRLESLNLGKNDFGVKGMQRLAPAIAASTLTELEVHQCNIRCEGLIALAQHLPDSKLTLLNLKNNQIGKHGVVALSRALPSSRLTELHLHANNLGDGVRSLGACLARTALRKLNLARVDIKNCPFSAGLVGSCLETLNLSSNSLGVLELDALCRALPQTRLTTLYLGDTTFSLESIEQLAKCLPHTILTTLDLRSCNIPAQYWHKDPCYLSGLIRTIPDTYICSLNLDDTGPQRVGTEPYNTLMELVQHNTAKYTTPTRVTY